MNRYEGIAKLRAAADAMWEALEELNHRIALLEVALLPNGFIDVDNTEKLWILTCNECGEVGRYDVVPYDGKTEAEKAWDAHETEHKERG